MKTKKKVKKQVSKQTSTAGKKGNHRPNTPWVSYERKLKAVKLYLEEGLPSDLVAKEIGVCHGTIFAWVKKYREHGEAGLKPKTHKHRRTNISPVVKEKITAVKKSNPSFGSKRISQFLKRVFCVQASPKTVSKTLKAAKLPPPAKKKKRRSRKPKVQFFERAQPNQLWQSDITQFRVLNKNAYLIGFMDDNSRYLVGFGVYRSQTAAQVIEVYRRAVGDYGVPREVLTDNGRQYVNWRGVSRFQKELRSDGVHHIKSATHHPQTLGKLERFWKSIKEEFLSRATFETFEECQERIAFWIKYYNHQRPHQGIDGMCPADRFYKIHKQLREVIERGIAENIQELALHGRVKDPFYVVGRLGQKSVVISAEKGEMKMVVSGLEEEKEPEEVDDQKGDQYAKESKAAGQGRSDEEREGGAESFQCPGEVPGGVVGLDRAAQAAGSVQRTGDQLDDVGCLAEPGLGGDALGAGAADGPSGRSGAYAGSQTAEAADQETEPTGGGAEQDRAAVDQDPAEPSEDNVDAFDMPANGYALLTKREAGIVAKFLAEKQRIQQLAFKEEADTIHESQENESQSAGDRDPQMGGCHRERPERSIDGHGRGGADGREPQDVLREGEGSAVRDGARPECEENGPAGESHRSGEGGSEEEAGRDAKGSDGSATDAADPGDPAGTGSWESREEKEAAETADDPGGIRDKNRGADTRDTPF